MTISKSSFIKKYQEKVSEPDIQKVYEAIEYAFKLTDIYGVSKINKAIFETAVKFEISEEILREKINDDSFILNERKNNE
jgi:hypothetical protein